MCVYSVKPAHLPPSPPHTQEELAFVFEMLLQFEDALVQYDELDALFTQYVLNFGAGGEQPSLPPS